MYFLNCRTINIDKRALGQVFSRRGTYSHAKRAKKLFKINMVHGNSTNLIRSGVFKIVRHPTYFSWTIIIFGAALISDSLISLIIGVLIYILLWALHSH